MKITQLTGDRKMMKFSALILGLAFTLSVNAQDSKSGDDVVAVCPKNVTVLAETETVRMIHYKLKSGQTCGMHRSLPGLGYVISGATVNITMADGTKFPFASKDGQTVNITEMTNSDEGSRGTLEMIILQYKN